MAELKLHVSKKTKDDEWYTQMKDIVAELQHYEAQFKGKVVYCPCDDAEWSNFPKYFKENFHHLGLKKLICSCYYPRKKNVYDIVENVESEKGYWCEYDGHGDFIRHEFVASDGDFRSPECLELLKQSDIVVTNPPFSLFRPFFKWLLENEKQFLVISFFIAPVYKDIFPYFMKDDVRLGYNRKFSLHCINRDGELMPNTVACEWVTNLKVDYEPPFFELTTPYDPEKHPPLTNYDAVFVKSLKDIPCDYYGVMAVPLTFFGVWNKKQFEVIGSAHYTKLRPMRVKVLFGRDEGKTSNFNARGIYVWDDNGKYLNVENNKKMRCVFNRIFVKRKDVPVDKGENSC